jgi:hypothetical protein
MNNMAITVTVTISEDLAERIKRGTGDPVCGLEHAVITALEEKYPDEPSKPMTVEEERQRLREAMADILAPQDWMSGLLEEWGGPMSPEEEEEYYRTMPVLDPPLSQTIIEMRDEERY